MIREYMRGAYRIEELEGTAHDDGYLFVWYFEIGWGGRC